MTAYYNEIDPYAAQCLRNLITAGLIASGDVDERSIVDVRAGDLAGYDQCHFFAGIGGWSLALRLAGWPDGRPVWTGSCPCQPFSNAGKREGFEDDRHLWPDWAAIISERRPAIIFGEQVASAVEWLRVVRGDLEAMDYAVGAIPIEAASAGAEHLRDRYWFVADREGSGVGAGFQEVGTQQDGAGTPRDCGVGDAGRSRLALGSIAENQLRDVRREGAPAAAASDRSTARHMGFANGDGWAAGQSSATTARHGCSAISVGDDYDWYLSADGKARRVKSGIRLLANGVPARVAKLRALGNAIVPQVAAEFIAAYRECQP